MDDKMAVMLGRNPLNWDSFCRAWGRSNMDGVQRGVFRRDSINDFASRPCWHRRAPRAIVWKTWLSLPTGKSSRRERPSCQLHFQQLEMAYLVIWSSPKCSNCISHWNYAARTTFTKSRPVNKDFQPRCAKTLPVEDWWMTKWQWCWAGILWTEILFAGLEAEATWMGCSVGYSEEIQSKILHRDRVDTEELPGLSFGRRGYP